MRVFAYRQGFVSHEGEGGSNSQGLRLKLLASQEVCSSVGSPKQLDERQTRLCCMAMESVGNVTKYLVQHPAPAALAASPVGLALRADFTAVEALPTLLP